MRPFTFLLSLLLLLALSTAQDPTCATGIRANNICCAASCGKCGGSGCHRFPGGGVNCCRGRIRDSGVSCADSNPPCLISDTSSGSGSDPGSGSRSGSADWKNIDSSISGSLRARHEACFVMARGKGYLIGGRGNRGMDVFDPITRTWSEGPEPPTQMHHMQCVVYKGKIYIPTSWFDSGPEQENTRMYIYNPGTLKWSSVAGMPERRRRGGAASVVVGNKIYVVAGNRGGHGPPAQTLGWMDYYDLDQKIWVTDLPDLPIPRDHVGGALVNGQLCIAGGRDGGADGFFGKTEKSVFCFDFGEDKWIQKEDIPTPRAGAATETLCDGTMMVAGGEGRFSAAFDEVEIFDGETWTSAPKLKRARHGTGLAVTPNCFCAQVFIASGSGARGGSPELTETEVYLPKGGDRICKRY